MSIPNLNRSRMRELVSLLPGIHFRELQRLLGVSFHTIRYHARIMCRNGDVLCERDGRYARLYPAGTGDRDRVIYSVLRRKSSRNVLNAFVKAPKLASRDIETATGLAKSTVSEILSDLIRLRVVKTSFATKNGIAYELLDADYVLDMLRRTRGTMNLVTDRFIDLWDL